MHTYSNRMSVLLSSAIAILLAVQSFTMVQASAPLSLPQDSVNTWYVSTGGSDANDCSTPATPCLTINTAVGKAIDGDVIKITEGSFVDGIYINKSISFFGGWDATFSSNSGNTFIEEKAITVDDNNNSLTRNVVIDKLSIRNINFNEIYALTNRENLTISNCEIYNTSAYGGIASYNTLAVQNCHIYNNSGAGIQSYGNASVDASQINDNINESTSGGGGILVNGGSLTITDSLIHDNKARYGGGGLAINSDTSLTISNSAIYENSTSEGNGGGIKIGGYQGAVNINNTTISGNQAQSGGGMYGGNIYYKTATLRNVTLINNEANSGGGIYGEAILYNTIFAYNTAPRGANCAPLSVVQAMENNIIYKADCAVSVPIGTEPDYVDVDPLLLPFIPEVGYAPLSLNSPAIDAGSPLTPGTPDSAACQATDQRGIARPQRSQCDIGAYELEFGSFYDVPKTFWAWRHIEAIYTAGITGGCSANPLNYCPNKQVTRAEMAIFLETGMNGSDFTPPDASGSIFNDVPADHWAAKWIEQLAADGITGGCGNGNYCPSTPINREQMAVFLLLAKHGPDYVPPAVEGDSGFNDVPADYWAAPWIKQLAAEGITGGCGGGNFCPKQLVTRDQMAVFLQITFGLPLP